MAEMDFRAHEENAASQQSSFGSSVERVVDHPGPNSLGLVITCLVLSDDGSVGPRSSGSLRGLGWSQLKLPSTVKVQFVRF